MTIIRHPGRMTGVPHLPDPLSDAASSVGYPTSSPTMPAPAGMTAREVIVVLDQSTPVGGMSVDLQPTLSMARDEEWKMVNVELEREFYLPAALVVAGIAERDVQTVKEVLAKMKGHLGRERHKTELRQDEGSVPPGVLSG